MEEVGVDISIYPFKLIDSEGKGETEKILTSGEIVLCQMNFCIYKVAIPVAATGIAIQCRSDLVSMYRADKKELTSSKLVPASVSLCQRLDYL